MESLDWLCWTAEAQGWSREEGDSADPTAGLGRGRWEEVAVPTSPTHKLTNQGAALAQSWHFQPPFIRHLPRIRDLGLVWNPRNSSEREQVYGHLADGEVQVRRASLPKVVRR